MKLLIGYALTFLTIVLAVPGASNAEDIICSNCGKNVEAGIEFCPHCGFGLNDIRQIRPEEIEYVNEAINGDYGDPQKEPGCTEEKQVARRIELED